MRVERFHLGDSRVRIDIGHEGWALKDLPAGTEVVASPAIPSETF
jgi:hypothetical protein